MFGNVLDVFSLELRSGCVVLFVRDNCSIAVGLVLTVWADRTTGEKKKRKLCSSPCPVSECYAFRVVELTVVSEDLFTFCLEGGSDWARQFQIHSGTAHLIMFISHVFSNASISNDMID